MQAAKRDSVMRPPAITSDPGYEPYKARSVPRARFYDHSSLSFDVDSTRHSTPDTYNMVAPALSRFALLAVLVAGASAQSQPFGQCGGQGFKGSITCPSG